MKWSTPSSHLTPRLLQPRLLCPPLRSPRIPATLTPLWDDIKPTYLLLNSTVNLKISSNLLTFTELIYPQRFDATTAIVWGTHWYCYTTLLVVWHSGRTSVFGRRTFLVLRSTCSWRVTIYVGKPSAIGQPTRPTQPFIPSGSINEY